MYMYNGPLKLQFRGIDLVDGLLIGLGKLPRYHLDIFIIYAYMTWLYYKRFRLQFNLLMIADRAVINQGRILNPLQPLPQSMAFC